MYIPRVLILGLILLPWTVAAPPNHLSQQQSLQGGTSQGGSACRALHRAHPFQTVYPGELVYNNAQQSYWAAQQSELLPSCRFLVFKSPDVAEAIRILTTFNASFAVVSGGHSSNVNASNIQDGVTIDLSHLTDVTLTDNDTAAWLHVGARWRNVYSQELAVKNLSVVGGRVANVGVGGHVLGGGFSWFSNQYGWTCDSVLAYEVVTPDARVLHVNGTAYADLSWALKGSLGAFGVVTRIKVPTIKNTGLYGGAISYSAHQLPQLFDALQELSEDRSGDLETQGYLSFGWSGDGTTLNNATYAAYLVNTKDAEETPSLKHFTNLPHLHSTLRHMSIRESAGEIDRSNTPGLRRRKFTLTLYSSRSAMMEVHRLCSLAITKSPLRRGETLGVTLQPLTVPMMQAGFGKNIFNLDPASGPLLLISLEFWWKDVERSESINSQMDALWDLLRHKFETRRLLHPFVYPNYASEMQDPFAELTEEAKQRLRQVRGHYDPDDVWRRLIPGVWHPG